LCYSFCGEFVSSCNLGFGQH